jgi:membrane-associated protease RseP (regulator of RpoE activity)
LSTKKGEEMKVYFVVTITFLLLGCANNFSKFYYDKTGGIDLSKSPNVILSNDDPKILRGGNPEIDGQNMLEQGYALVGYSSFNSKNVNENQAILQAKQVYASVVILYSKYTHTVSGSIPLTLPTTHTSTTDVVGNTYGPGGVNTFSGTATTTTYGSQTTYIPYSVDRYDFLATYWIKRKPPVLGVIPNDLNQETRQKIGSNKGVIVRAVVKNSPAFRADILKDDIIRKIEDMEVFDARSFLEAVAKYQGRTVNIIILRNGQEINKEIKLNERS